MTTELNIDIETYSPVDLKKAGVYPYANHPDFEILLFAYAFDKEQVTVIDLKRGQKIPERVMKALYDERVTKTAFNAMFERTCINVHLLRNGMPEMPVGSWECTMVKAAMLGLPLSLGKVAEVLRLPQQKMGIGMSLIRYFCIPCKPTKTNGMRTRNLPEHDIEKWQLFIKYCGQDVNTERNIRQVISAFKIPETEVALYKLDQEINDRGVLIDRKFVDTAISIDSEVKERLISDMVRLTGMDNPKSGPQLKAWLLEETEEEFSSVTKATIPDIIKKYPQDVIKQVLSLKLELNKTSVMKYKAMTNSVGFDNRIRGLTQFYGANRTGRWSGRIVQMQNLPQNHISNLDLARNLVLTGDTQLIEMFYSNVPDTLSQLIRTSFIASLLNLLYVADFSAIEARIIAWLANERWRLEAFKRGDDIYCASASMMFGVTVEKHGQNSHLRQKGKISELALGYQGGKGALETMGAKKMGIPEEEWQGLVDQWRAASPNIVKLWYKMNSAALEAISGNGKQEVAHGVFFSFTGRNLYMYLPSGRRLCYMDAHIGVNRFGSPSICYYGMDQETKRWGKQETYGGKLVENCVQAIARDCLAVSMLRLDAEGYPIVFHVHDEVIIDFNESHPDATLKNICSIMGQDIPWAPGLLLTADGYYTSYYKKD